MKINAVIFKESLNLTFSFDRAKKKNWKPTFNQQTIKLSGHFAVAFMRATIAIYPIYSILLCLSCKFADIEYFEGVEN